MPLMIIRGSSGSIYEILVNSIGDPLISALNATDKITDEQALAAQITLALSGNVKHLTPENLAKIKTVLTSKFKVIAQKSGKNAKEIALELKSKIATAVGKNKNILFNIGDKIADISIDRIKQGTNGKIAIIGRAMGNENIKGVRDVYKELVTKGYKNVEIFDKSALNGKWLDEFLEAEADMTQKVSDNGGKWLDNNQIITTKMYQFNKKWVQHLIDEGYEILDMGDIYYKAGEDRGFSVFYAMEKSIIFK